MTVVGCDGNTQSVFSSSVRTPEYDPHLLQNIKGPHCDSLCNAAGAACSFARQGNFSKARALFAVLRHNAHRHRSEGSRQGLWKHFFLIILPVPAARPAGRRPLLNALASRASLRLFWK